MQKRHAYMIMAYNNFRQLKMLLELLDDPRNDIYVHIDKRAGDFPEEMLRSALKHSSITFIDRKNVYWADFSQTDVTLDLMQAAANKAHYHYYHLLSGMCLPLKTQDEIHAFFENEDHEFLAMVRNGGGYSKQYINYYHFMLHNPFYRKSKILKGIDRCLMYAQKLIGLDRLKNNPMLLSPGWTWFSITDDFCRYVLENRQMITRVFRYTVASDEHFMGTMATNSHYYNRVYMVEERDSCKRTMRCIDWERGKPYIWGTSGNEEDYQILMNSGCLFARKFDERVNYELIERIYLTLMSKQRAGDVEL